ncbi:MAG: small multi-drug export protein [Peptococcaceae bacterium]|jgi:uncharacterized membrane protein|nr:small multi-drug export protein [Peptococcaceae bacterium]
MLDWFSETALRQLLGTLLVSVVPVIELRGAIPIGVALGLHPFWAMLASIVGNMLPVPFIILFVRHVFTWLKRHSPLLGRLVQKLEDKAHNKSAVVIKYRAIGLCLLVAVPFPGTGAWTGSLVAALLDIPLREAVPTILLGVIIAGLIVTGVTCGVITIF